MIHISFSRFSGILRFLLPCLIITVCNGLIIFHIIRMSRAHAHSSRAHGDELLARHSSRDSSTSQSTRTSRDVHSPHHMAIYTLFAVCAVFVITLIPNAILSMILYIEFMLIGNSNLYCLLRTLDAPFHMVRLINYSINVVLYGLTGRRFRTELHRLFNKFRSNCLSGLCNKQLRGVSRASSRSSRPIKEHILFHDIRPITPAKDRVVNTVKKTESPLDEN